MIVVIGTPAVRAQALGGGAAGTAARTALAAASGGAEVQLAGRVGDDPDGDALVLALAHGGVGHVALLRDPGRRTPVVVADAPETIAGGEEPFGTERVEPADPRERPTLEPADVELALRYLTDFRVLVVPEPQSQPVLSAAAEAARYTGARLIVAVNDAAGPPDAIVLAAPEADPDGTFAELVGEYAAALDRGEDPEAAFRFIVERRGWEPPSE